MATEENTWGARGPCAVLLLVAVAAAQAPPGRWYVEGGSAGRSGASLEAPVLQRPAVAWRQTASGVVLGEPLVWDDFLAIGVRVNDKRRALEVRRLDTGALVGKRELEGAVDPSPTLWGNEVVWRGGTAGLELVRFGDKGVFPRAHTARGDFGPPLRLGASVYAVVDGCVGAMRAADLRPLWKSPVCSFAPVLAADDDHLYGVRRSGDRWCVTALARATGERVADSAEFSCAKPPGEDARLQFVGDRLFARLGDGHVLTDFVAPGLALDTVELQLPLAAHPQIRPTSVPVLNAFDGERRIGMMGFAGGARLGMMPTGADSGLLLDACEAHRALAATPPTMVHGVVYFGPVAVETGEFHVLWWLRSDDGRPLPRSRAVPAGRTLLLWQDRELVALREDVPADPVGAELGPPGGIAGATGSRRSSTPRRRPGIRSSPPTCSTGAVSSRPTRHGRAGPRRRSTSCARTRSARSTRPRSPRCASRPQRWPRPRSTRWRRA